MEITYLLIAGVPVSIVHAYLVWKHRDNRKYSISEHAIIDRHSHLLYIATHVVTVIFYLLYSYQFFLVKHNLLVPHILNCTFAALDLVQAIVPSRGKTEKTHIVAAYTSWLCYVIAGIMALASLTITEPYKTLAILTMVPVVGMFLYMHINRSKLYPYQLLMVPLFVLALLFITLGA